MNAWLEVTPKPQNSLRNKAFNIGFGITSNLMSAVLRVLHFRAKEFSALIISRVAAP
jgi:hypothetical protein